MFAEHWKAALLFLSPIPWLLYNPGYLIFPPHKQQSLLQLLLLGRVVSLFRSVTSLLQRTA